MSDAPIGTVTMNPSIDQHIVIDRLIKDDAIRAREIRRDPGGKGINVSRVLKELGADTLAYGITGGGAGYIVKSLLRERGIPFEAIEVLEETRINFILTDRSDRTQTRVSSPGPWVTLDGADELIARALAHRPPPAWWVLGGSLPRGVPADFYARMIRRLQADGARCFLDADNDALKIGIEGRPYGIKPNDYELGRLVGRTLRTESDILDAARAVVAQGVQVVAATLGEKGALVVSPERSIRAFAPAVDVKSKVGAGDSFLAGLVLALARGDSLEDATKLAISAGTAAVTHEGTQLCRGADVERLLGEIRIESRRFDSPPPIQPERAPRFRDVVCGMELDPTLAEFAAKHDGHVYHFCSLACERRFERQPDRYANRGDELSTVIA